MDHNKDWCLGSLLISDVQSKQKFLKIPDGDTVITCLGLSAFVTNYLHDINEKPNCIIILLSILTVTFPGVTIVDEI